MPKLQAVLDLIKNDPVKWMMFMIIPAILLCIVCLIPRGKGKVLLNIERAVIIIGMVSVLVIPFIADAIKPGVFGFDPVKFIIKDGIFLSAAMVALIFTVVWGIFTGKSYITQGLYGMLSTILLPYGFICMVFPVWFGAEPSLATVFTTGEYLFRLLQFATLFFVPLWLIRTGEYKMRLSSIWHLLGGISLGGVVGMFVIESGMVKMPGINSFIKTLAEMKNNFEAFGFNFKKYDFSAIDTQFIMSLIAFILFAVAATLAVAGCVTLIRKLNKSEISNFVSESVLGFVIRTAGNALAVLVCAGCALILPFTLGATTMPLALVYLVPIPIYFFILIASAFLADMVEIKRGIQLANDELNAKEDAPADTAEALA